MVVVKVVDQHVADKIDTDYISEQFAALENISIIFICAKGGGEGEDGIHYIVIHLPYEEVRQLQDARPMMLAKAKERLGLAA